jgi:hypothetical protein
MVFEASRTTAWYLNPCGACPRVTIAITAVAMTDRIVFFIAIKFIGLKYFGVFLLSEKLG